MSAERLQPETSTSAIQHEGYLSVPFGLSGGDMDELFTEFGDFMAELDDVPPTTRQQWYEALLNSVPGRNDDSTGFVTKRRRGEANPFELRATRSTEDKDVLHWTPRSLPQASARFGSQNGLPSPMRRLLERCGEIHTAAVQAVRPVLEELGLAELVLAPDGQEEDMAHIVRVIHYLGRQAATPELARLGLDPLAQLHFDRSKLTLAVWESSPGLVGAPAQNQRGEPGLTLEEFDAYAEQAWSAPIAHRSGEAKLFAGASYNYLPEENRQASGDLPLLLHGVADAQPGQPRDAVVVFMNERASVPSLGVAPQAETDYDTLRQLLQQPSAVRA